MSFGAARRAPLGYHGSPGGLLLLLSALCTLAYGRSTGIVNRSTTGCNNCHGAAPTAGTTVSFGAAPASVLPGEVLALTLTVSSTNVSHAAAGLNVAATGGTLSAGANTKIQSGQITHPTPALFTAGSVTFHFTWTAPATEGQYTLTAAGNAVNNLGTSAGDAWNLASGLVILVDDGCDDIDSDGVDTCSGDCDDNDPLSYPGASEICDGADNDCDTLTDNDAIDAISWYFDGDSDSYGTGAATLACEAPLGYVSQDGDCNDSDAAYHPSAPETDCGDPNDYNCDGLTGYSDNDGDTYAACEDCDDNDPLSYPGASEICDGADNDCAGAIDNDAIDALPWYTDGDGDGYGTGDPVYACEAPPTLTDLSGDCNDENAAVHPGQDERCDPNDIDEDCDGLIDDDDAPADPIAWYPDEDIDGFGAGEATLACEAPPGYRDVAGDCNDLAADTNPGASEICDGADNDCDEAIDDDADDATVWYPDLDGDAYGTADGLLACDPPPDHVAQDGDCNDANSAFYPGAPETDCDDLADYNCDGTVGPADGDNDGFTACEECNDADASVFPGQDEICDGIDNNCDGATDEAGALGATTFYRDSDLDGYGIAGDTLSACVAPEGYAPLDGDCDDIDGLISPGATEIWYDGTDSDCDGRDDFDQDSDGHRYPLDCEDLDPTVNPGVDDPPCDEIDVDCDPVPDDAVSCGPTVVPDDATEPANKGCGCASAELPGALALLAALCPLVIRGRGRPSRRGHLRSTRA